MKPLLGRFQPLNCRVEVRLALFGVPMHSEVIRILYPTGPAFGKHFRQLSATLESCGELRTLRI